MSIDLSHLVEGLMNQTDELLANFVFNGYAALVSSLAKPLALMMTLSIVCLGYAVHQGWVKLEYGVLSKHIFKVIFVYVFATSWTLFNEVVYQVLTNSPNEVVSGLIQSLQVPFAGGSVNQALQIALNTVGDILLKLMGQSNFYHWSPFIIACLLCLGSILLFGIALVEIIVAKFLLAILLVLAPFFIPLYLFESTRRMFDKWLGAAVGVALVPMFVITILVLVLSLVSPVLADAKQAAESGVEVNFSQVIPFLITSLVSIGLLTQASSIAKHIGGDVATGHGLGVLGTGVAAAVGSFMGAKKVINRASGKIRGIGSSRSTMSVGIHHQNQGGGEPK